jgi:hypothetical protein
MFFRVPASGDGAIAQLGERVLCKHEVVGSIPSGSTKVFDCDVMTAVEQRGAAAPYPSDPI